MKSYKWYLMKANNRLVRIVFNIVKDCRPLVPYIRFGNNLEGGYNFHTIILRPPKISIKVRRSFIIKQGKFWDKEHERWRSDYKVFNFRVSVYELYKKKTYYRINNIFAMCQKTN